MMKYWRNLTNCKYETYLPNSCSNDAALPGTDAVWLFPIGTICSDDSVWAYGISLLSEPEDGGNVGVWRFGFVVPTYI